LLALPQLQDVSGQHILIVRGDGGREKLKETLEQRGATVEYIEAYRRQLPKRNPANLIQNWAAMAEVVTVTSNQVLDNLFTLLGEDAASLLQKTPLLVVSQRMAEHATERGCEVIYVANSAMNQEMLQSLCEMNAEIFG